MSDLKNVLFVCTGNSARSIMAEAIMNSEGRGRFCAFSAGTKPRGYVHPLNLHLLQRLNHDTSVLRSKSWEEFTAPDAPEMDFVITVCDRAAAETAPLWPGHPARAHWGLPDPVKETGNETEQHLAFSDTYRWLRNRVSIFANLPLGSLEGLALQERLDAIGRVPLNEVA